MGGQRFDRRGMVQDHLLKKSTSLGGALLTAL